MEKYFTVVGDEIHAANGMVFDNIAVILDKDGGLQKYGNATGEHPLGELYQDMVHTYRVSGLTDIAEKLVYVELKPYVGIITLDEVCVLCNYMLMCSANGKRVMALLEMDAKDLKVRLKELEVLGY